MYLRDDYELKVLEEPGTIVPLKKEAPALDEIGKVLWRAAEIVQESGWVQGTWCRDGGVCMVEAVTRAANGKYTDGLGKPAHLSLLAKGYGMGWNDLPGRTKGEVIEALRSTALTRAQAALGRLS